MPTKRKRIVRGRTNLTMETLSLPALLQFLSGWGPPTTEFEQARSRWRTWDAYLGDWLALREECLAAPLFQRSGDVFAEKVLRCYGRSGPPSGATYDEVCRAIEAADDAAARELLADIAVK